MEIHQVNPSSWQPLLCIALLDELQPFCCIETASNNESPAAVFAYLSGRRGRAILEILALAQWKGLSNADAFLQVLTKAWKLMHQVFIEEKEAGNDGDSIHLQEFDILLTDDCDDFLHDSNIVISHQECRHRVALGQCRPHSHPRAYVQMKKRKVLEKLRNPVLYNSSDDEEVKSDSDPKQRRRHFSSALSSGLLGYPVVQEDSDGFPAGWCDDGLATITEGSRMNVDDIILPIIRAALPRKLKLEDDEPAVILTLLACLIRKALPFLALTADSTAIWNFIDVYFASSGCSEAQLMAQSEMLETTSQATEASSSETVITLKRELLVRRHGLRTLISALVIRKSHQYYEVLGNSIDFLLQKLKIICQSLSAAPLTLDYFEILRTEGCMEYLLEMAADVVTGIFRLITCLISSSSNGNNDETVGDTLETVTDLLAMCKEASLEEMVRDVCIGLDLLAAIDFAAADSRPFPAPALKSSRNQDAVGKRSSDHFSRMSESETKPYLDNVYHGKLYTILFHIVALVNFLQRLASKKAHLATCSRSNHRSCCVMCAGRHHTTGLEFTTPTRNDVSAAASASDKCTIAYLEKLVVHCLRNVAGFESKQMFVEALESFPSCCCVSKMHLLIVSLEELAESASLPSGRSLLVDCFVSKLSKESSCSRHPVSTCRVCGRVEGQPKTIGHHGEGKAMMNQENYAFVTAWRCFTEKTPSTETGEVIIRLLHCVFPSLDDDRKEKITYTAVIPWLAKWCRDQDQHLKSTTGQLLTRELHLFFLLIELCEAGVKSLGGYRCAVDELMDCADLLFHHPDTRTTFLQFIRRMAAVEWDVLDGTGRTLYGKDNPEFAFNRFLFNKYYMVGKLILNDTQNFVSDAAREFWLMSTALLDTCCELLASRSPLNMFRLIFTDFGGFVLACRILEAVVQSLAFGGLSKSVLDEQSAHRLVQLLCDTVGLCLASGASEEKMASVFTTLHSLQHHLSTSSSSSDSNLPIYLAKRLLDIALKPAGSICHVKESSGLYGDDSQGVEEGILLPYLSVSKELADTAFRMSDDGYEADGESSTSTAYRTGLTPTVVCDVTTEEIRSQTRLCMICIGLISGALSGKFGATTTDQDDLGAVFIEKLSGYCSKSKQFTKLLIEEKCVALLVKLITQAGEKMEAIRPSSLKLVFLLFQVSPQHVDLKETLRLFNDRSGAFQVSIIECLALTFANTPYEPTSYLTFPQLHNAHRWAEESARHISTTGRRSRSVSPQKPRRTASPLGAADLGKYDRSTTASPPTTVSAGGPFAPLLSGLSSFFTFGGGSSSKSSLKKKNSFIGKAVERTNSGQETPTVGSHKNAGLGGGAFALFPEAAIAFSMDGTAKSSVSRGMSVGVWTFIESRERKADRNEFLHLLTLGDDKLSCSLFLKRASTTILVRVSSGGVVVAEYTRPKFVPLEKWTHLLLVTTLSKDEQLTIKVFCDGARETVWRVPWNSSELKNSMTSFVCIGAATTKADQANGYRLGTVAGFRGEMSFEHSILLRAFGPRCVSVTDTKMRRLDGDLASFIHAGLLLSRNQQLKVGTLTEDRMGLVEHMQKNQAFVYHVGDSDQVFIYAMNSNATAPPGADDGNLCQKLPIPKHCGKQTELVCGKQYSVDEAIAALGGLKLFIFLFARAVEFEQSEECQASALRLLLQTASRNPEWWRLFLDLRGYVIISRILSTQYCHRGYKLLQTIFDFALSVNVFEWPKPSPSDVANGFSSNSTVTDQKIVKPNIVGVEFATIQDPFALTCFLLDPDIWKDSDGLTVWQLGLETILRLLTDPPPIIAAFNACQLNKAKFLKFFFYTLTERSQDSQVQLSPNIATIISAISVRLIGSPPNLLELTSCWDFVFLTHPASSTYLNYRIGGPSEWLDPDILTEPVVRLDNYESKLGTRLRQLMNSMGKGAFIDWITSEEPHAEQPGAVAVNRVFEADVSKLTVDREASASSSSTSDVFLVERSTDNIQQLPDLVCDIDVNAAAVEMTDSMRTTTQSTGLTDDEMFPVDEYIDAASDTGGSGTGKWAATGGQGGSTIDPHWLVETRGALLSVVCDVLAQSPENIYRRVAGSVVKWEHLLVMLRRQTDVAIRTACMKALCFLLMRFNNDQRLQFLKANGFALLANQLREHPCAPETVDGLFSVLFGENVRIEDGVDIECASKLVVDRFRAGVIKPLLVAYQNSVDDLSLFWNMSTAFCRLFQYNCALAQTMLEVHFGEVLANVLLQLCLRHHGDTDLSGITEGSLMIEAWRSLTGVVLHRCITRSNVLHHQAFSEMLQLIHCAAVTSIKFGIDPHTFVRKELCVLIQLAFESIRQLFDDGGASAIPGSPLPPFLSNMSSRLSTPLQSGRTTPLFLRDEISSVWNNSNAGSTGGKIVMLSGSTPIPLGEKRRSSLSGSFTNLKDKLLNISQGNLAQATYGSSDKVATQSELLDRWKMLVQYSTDYFMFFSTNDCFEERHLFDFLLHFAVNTLANESSIRKRGNTWHSLMWSGRAKLQQFLSHMLVFVLYPAERNLSRFLNFGGGRPTTDPILAEEVIGLWFRRRLLITEAFAHEPQAKAVMKYALDSVTEWQSVVTAAIYELLLCDYRLSDIDSENCQKVLRLLKQLKTKSPFDEYDNADEIVHNVCLDERMTLEVYMSARSKWFERMKNFATRLRDRHRNAAQVLSDDAMSITCAVVSEQNVPRKLFIQLKKQAANDLLMAEENLRILVIDLCHPAGSCFDAASWPVNWRLDPTEGPNRERRRLAPAHLTIAEKFLLPESRWKLAPASETRPLVKLLSGSSPDSVAVSTIAGQLLDRLRIEEKIIFNCSAVVIRTSFECEGELLLADRALYFVGESSRSSQKGLPLDSVISMNWPYHFITAVHRRYFQLIDLALEIFFADGETYLIAFETKEKRELFVNRLLAMDLPNLTTYSDHLLQTLTSWWREGNITNFQYLMQLNTLAGRTFNDLMQYPVFPFILSEYTSLTLNLNSVAVYRNFAKPIAIQDLQMESHYLYVYRSLDNDFKRNARSLAASDGMPIIGAYHYGSHYSNSGIVVHYLVRLPPFTQLVLEYQDNNFDLPDRTFHSLSTAYRLSTSESTTDFKELIPEFFFLGEFLTNREDLNLGQRQNGQSISDVELPPWTPDADARLFVLIHRQALESAYVSAHLHEWVDLIFGYKQTGQAAIDAINVFHPATYHGTLAAAARSDEIGLKALNTMVRTYGQMPKQLFRTPHLPHLIAQNYLAASNKQHQSPLFSVNGIRWGHYVGSPDLPEPTLVLKQRNHGYSNVKPVSLMSLADGSCVGYPSESTPLVLYGSVKKDLWLANVKEVDRIFVLSWEFGDKVIRLRAVFPPDASGQTWTNVIALHDDEISCYASSPGSSVVFFGLKRGVVLIYKVDIVSECLRSCALVRSLYGHSGSPTAIDVCSDYSVLVTGSETGECFVWDYNKLNFVLALRKHTGPVTHICISKTTCDVVTVALKGWGSELVLHTINGRVIGAVETDIVITSITMSAAPEGTAVNCIAAGMQNGLIRLWNTWTLAPIREICHSHFLEPIVSLAYSHNSLKLYACTKSGAVLCWDSGASKQIRPPRFFCLNVS